MVDDGHVLYVLHHGNVLQSPWNIYLCITYVHYIYPTVWILMASNIQIRKKIICDLDAVQEYITILCDA